MLLLQSTNFGPEMVFKAPVCNNIKQAELCLPRAFSYWFLSDRVADWRPLLLNFWTYTIKKLSLSFMSLSLKLAFGVGKWLSGKALVPKFGPRLWKAN